MGKRNLKLENPKQITLEVATPLGANSSQVGDFIECFNGYGCVLLNCSSDYGLRENLLTLHSLLGPALSHRSSDADGVVTITPVEGATYTALTTQSFTFHTDGCFMPNPPKAFALQCEVPSSTGGLSLLIQGESVYNYLADQDPEGLDTLFDEDAMSISTVDNEVTQGPVFASYEGLTQIAYRASDHQVTITPKPTAKRAFQLLQDYVCSSANQFIFKLEANQILVVDNTRLLHNRTPFLEGEQPKRRLYRLWFRGDSSLSDPLQYGFSQSS